MRFPCRLAHVRGVDGRKEIDFLTSLIHPPLTPIGETIGHLRVTRGIVLPDVLKPCLRIARRRTFARGNRIRDGDLIVHILLREQLLQFGDAMPERLDARLFALVRDGLFDGRRRLFLIGNRRFPVAANKIANGHADEKRRGNEHLRLDHGSPCLICTQNHLKDGGRYWTRTSDPYRVNDSPKPHKY